MDEFPCSVPRGISVQSILGTSFPTLDSGKGDRIRFWEDVWYDETLLSKKFPWIYLVSCKKDFSSILYTSTAPSLKLGWDLGLHRGSRDCELQEISSLTQSLFDIFLDPNAQDNRIWSLFSNGLCKPTPSQALLISHLHQTNSSLMFPVKVVWNIQGPPSYKVLCWKVAHKSVNTGDMLQRWQK